MPSGAHQLEGGRFDQVVKKVGRQRQEAWAHLKPAIPQHLLIYEDFV
jgi:hypothetical protein